MEGNNRKYLSPHNPLKQNYQPLKYMQSFQLKYSCQLNVMWYPEVDPRIQRGH